MAKPALNTKTPDDPATNALIDFHGELIENPNESRIAIVEIIVPKIETRPSTGDTRATVQVVHLELMHGSDMEAAEKLFTRVHFDRTGNKTRPAPGESPAPLGTELDGLDDSVE